VKRKVVHFIAALVAVFVFGVESQAYAGAASDVVRTKQSSLFDLLKQGTPESQKKIDAIFDEMLDYTTLAQSSLGDEWAPRTDAERAQFSDLLKQLVRKAYQKNLKKILDFDVNYTGEEPVDSIIRVKTKSQAKNAGARDEPIEINFKMASKEVKGQSRWLVQDIETEGVSLVSSYRSQFTKIIKKDGFPALIKKMQDKLAKGDTG
jgi:phospholipid transport system substrate-binding protein